MQTIEQQQKQLHPSNTNPIESAAAVLGLVLKELAMKLFVISNASIANISSSELVSIDSIRAFTNLSPVTVLK